MAGKGYRLIVEGLDQMTSWQDLKDFGRTAGESVAFADVYSGRRGGKEGVIEYHDFEDFKHAAKYLDDARLNGVRVRVFEDKKRNEQRDGGGGGRHRMVTAGRRGRGSRDRSRSRSRSRSRDRVKRRMRSRSRSASKGKESGDEVAAKRRRSRSASFEKQQRRRSRSSSKGKMSPPPAHKKDIKSDDESPRSPGN